MRRRNLLLLLGLSLLGSAAFLFNKRGVSIDGRTTLALTPAATVQPVIRGTISHELTVAGVFAPYQEVDLHAKVSGYIRRIKVDIGDRVRAGEVIVTLEVPELGAQVTGAQAQVRHSESEIIRSQSEVRRAQASYAAVHSAYERLRKASAQRPGLVAEQELDDARARDENAAAQIDVAKASVEATQQQLGMSRADQQRVQTMSDYSVVTAPFNGVITKRYADTGALIQAGTMSNTQAMPVVRIAESDLLRLRIPIPEADIRFLQTGTVVGVKVDSLNRAFSGKIVRYTRALDGATRTMLAELEVPNANLSLSPGMYASTNVVLQRHDRVLCVRNEAIVEDGDRYFVLIVTTANTVERRPVQVGIQGVATTEILSGLSEGDLTITSGQANYQPGEVVRPERVAMAGKESAR